MKNNECKILTNRFNQLNKNIINQFFLIEKSTNNCNQLNESYNKLILSQIIIDKSQSFSSPNQTITISNKSLT